MGSFKCSFSLVNAAYQMQLRCGGSRQTCPGSRPISELNCFNILFHMRNGPFRSRFAFQFITVINCFFCGSQLLPFGLLSFCGRCSDVLSYSLGYCACSAHDYQSIHLFVGEDRLGVIHNTVSYKKQRRLVCSGYRSTGETVREGFAAVARMLGGFDLGLVGGAEGDVAHLHVGSSLGVCVRHAAKKRCIQAASFFCQNMARPVSSSSE